MWASWRTKKAVLPALVVGAAALLLVADRATLVLVERAAAGRIQDCLGASERPGVNMSGFPFLVDLARGRLDSMELTAKGVDAQGVRVDELRVTAKGVERQGEGGSVDELTGTGLVGYGAMSATAPGVSVAWGGDGKFKITAGLSVFSASALARPSIVDGVLTVAPEQVSTPLFGELNLGELPTIRYRLRELPQGMDVELNPTERGLEFAFEGTDVVLPGTGCPSGS